MRVPVIRAFTRSPFDGLLKHAAKVKQCAAALQEAMEAYCRGEYKEFKDLANKVSKLEEEADWIKGNIRNHLPRGIWMPVDKADFLMALKEQDAILDFAEDAVVWLSFRKTPIPEELRERFLDHLSKVVETVIILEQVMENVKLLVTSPRRGDREMCKEKLKEVHHKEWEADQIERRLALDLFNNELDPVSLFHLLKVVDLIGDIANHAENVGDRVRAMMAR